MGGSVEPAGDLSGVRPVSLARDRGIPVLDSLVPALPQGGLARGTAVAVGGAASTSLALALLARATVTGSWAAVVGVPSLGVVAASELGIALERLALVPAVDSSRWLTVVGALVDALDVVVVSPPHRVAPGDARRLLTRARARGAVVIARGEWPHADVRLDVVHQRWVGVESGSGHLRARRVTVVTSGRGAATRRRQVELWLPSPEGGVRPVQPDTIDRAGEERRAPSEWHHRSVRVS